MKHKVECLFCGKPCYLSSETWAVAFCWDHLLRFYLGLKYTGWID